LKAKVWIVSDAKTNQVKRVVDTHTKAIMSKGFDEYVQEFEVL